MKKMLLVGCLLFASIGLCYAGNTKTKEDPLAFDYVSIHIYNIGNSSFRFVSVNGDTVPINTLSSCPAAYWTHTMYGSYFGNYISPHLNGTGKTEASALFTFSYNGHTTQYQANIDSSKAYSASGSFKLVGGYTKDTIRLVAVEYHNEYRPSYLRSGQYGYWTVFLTTNS